MLRDRVAEVVLLSCLILCASCSGPTGDVGCGRQKDVTLILGASDAELKPILEELEDKRECDIEGIGFMKGKLNGRDAVVAWTGVGKVNATMTTTLLIGHFQPSVVIVCGIAGAVNPELGVGDVVVAEKSVQHDLGLWTEAGFESKGFRNRLTGERNPVFFAADARLLDIAERAVEKVMLKSISIGVEERPAKVKKGLVATGDTFIMSPQKRSELRRRLGADMVEMEGAAIAQICHQRGIAHIVIRGISDTADEKAIADAENFQEIAAYNCASVVMQMVQLLAMDFAATQAR
jgi:adenosylhomocysteine nucleosidase